MTNTAQPLESGSATADRDLLAAARRGDGSAFAALVGRHERIVHAFLRARLTAATDIDDLCQEVFVRLYSGGTAPDASGESGLRPWIVGIARNVLREHVRAAQRREHGWTRLCLELESAGDSAAEHVGRFDEALVRLPGCLEGLGPTARQAIELYYAGESRLADQALDMLILKEAARPN